MLAVGASAADLDVDDNSIGFRSSASRVGLSSCVHASIGNMQIRDHEALRATDSTATVMRPDATTMATTPSVAQRRAQIAVEHQRAYIEDRRQSERRHHAKVGAFVFNSSSNASIIHLFVVQRDTIGNAGRRTRGVHAAHGAARNATSSTRAYNRCAIEARAPGKQVGR